MTRRADAASIERMRDRARPTARQIYALAAILCERYGQAFPETQAEASRLIERLRFAQGHPQPRLEDVPLPPSRRRGRGTEKLAKAIAEEVIRAVKTTA
jgi:hypothetical protein